MYKCRPEDIYCWSQVARTPRQAQNASSRERRVVRNEINETHGREEKRS